MHWQEWLSGLPPLLPVAGRRKGWERAMLPGVSGDRDPSTGQVGGPDFGVSVDWRNRTVVVSVSGDIDLVTAPQLDAALTRVLRERPDVVVVDLVKVEFLASAGLTVLIGAHQRAVGRTRLRVVADGVATRRPLQLTGLDRQFPVFVTLEQALASD